MSPETELIGWLVFIERLVGHVAWPAAVFGVSLVFKQQIVQAIARLKTIRHKETEVTFTDLLDQASEEASSLPVEINSQKLDKELIENYPHLAISEGWRKIENLIGEIVATEWPRLPERDFLGIKGFQHFKKLEIADPSLIRLIDDLRRVRNEAVHSWDGDITVGQALEFSSLAARVEQQLIELKKKVPING